MSLPPSRLAWAQDKQPGKEHVLLPNFVRKFGFAQKESANRAFLKLINSNNLRQSRRTNLRKLFKESRRNVEEAFWSEYILGITTKITTKQTAAAVQKSGAKQAQRFIDGLDNNEQPEEYVVDPDDNESDKGEKEETVRSSDNDGNGYTTTDFYEPDDLSHLDRLGGQADNGQAADEDSDADGEDNVAKALKCDSEVVFQKTLIMSSPQLTMSSPVHSFMIDCDDKGLATKFTASEWREVCEEWPETMISTEFSKYIEPFADVDTLTGVKEALCARPE
ncbi:hypothetical protein BGW38_004066, partial [Lunasporangiospora selenospora]